MRSIVADPEAGMSLSGAGPALVRRLSAGAGARPGHGTPSLDDLVNALDRAVARSAAGGQAGHAQPGRVD